MYLRRPTSRRVSIVVGLLTSLRQKLLRPRYVLAIRRSWPFPVSTTTSLLRDRSRLMQELTWFVAAGLSEFDGQLVGAPVGFVQQTGRLPTHRGSLPLVLTSLPSPVRVTLWFMTTALASDK